MHETAEILCSCNIVSICEYVRQVLYAKSCTDRFENNLRFHEGNPHVRTDERIVVLVQMTSNQSEEPLSRAGLM